MAEKKVCEEGAPSLRGLLLLLLPLPLPPTVELDAYREGEGRDGPAALPGLRHGVMETRRHGGMEVWRRMARACVGTKSRHLGPLAFL